VSLEAATSAFLKGCRVALATDGSTPALYRGLLDLDPAERPFAFEGGAMECRLLDHRDGGGRLDSLFAVAEGKWDPLLRLGVGCALARLGAELPRDAWTLDGFGFQMGLLGGISGSRRSSGGLHYQRGKGRALWFLTGGRAEACARRLRGSDAEGALWRGVGTACAFAGDPLGGAGDVVRLADGFEEEVRAGVRDAVSLWRSLEGAPPDRTLAVEEAVGRPRG